MDDGIMAARAVQISLDEQLLRRVDRDPEARRLGRSRLIASALQLYLEAKRRRAVDEAIRHAYRGKADPLLKDIEGLMERQAWPDT